MAVDRQQPSLKGLVEKGLSAEVPLPEHLHARLPLRWQLLSARTRQEGTPLLLQY